MLHNNKWYRRVGLILLASIYLLVSHLNYEKVLNSNKDLIISMENTTNTYEDLVQKWRDSYDILQNDYGALIVENANLRTAVEKYDHYDLPVYNYSEEEIELLAKCCQCESGVNNFESQRRVAGVVLNRVRSGQFPDTIKDVIYEEKVKGIPQFSVAYDGTMDTCILSPAVLANVYSVIVHGSDLPDYVLYFYSAYLEEDNWVKTLPTYEEVEGTVFAYACKK